MGRIRVFALLVVAAALAGGVPAFAAPTGQSATTTVTVTMMEFSFKLSKKTVSRGTVLFKVVNRGTVVHDFKIAGKKTQRLLPARSQTLRVVFTKAGRYKYWCTLPGHEPAGMRGVLVVR